MKVGTWIARLCLAICVVMFACGGPATTTGGETLGSTTEALGTSTMSVLIPGGAITTNATIVKQDTTSVVTGTPTEHASIVPQTRSWAVNFPATNQGLISVESGQTHEPLSPGSFGDVTLKGSMTISAGTYYFRS